MVGSPGDGLSRSRRVTTQFALGMCAYLSTSSLLLQEVHAFVIVTDRAGFGVAGLVSPLVGLFRVESAVPMGIIMLACGVLAALSL